MPPNPPKASTAATVLSQRVAEQTQLYKQIYGPIPVGKEQTRLLRIKAEASPSDVLACDLEVSPINYDSKGGDPAYCAVSYTWGQEPFNRTIQVNGQDLPCTSSCYDALAMLRTQGQHLVWIDQISIDQSNLAERSAQITLMGSIYWAARSVFVWLGRSKTCDNQTLSAGIRLIQNISRYYLPGTETAQSFEDFDNEMAWTGLLEIVSRPYFRRKWCLQETTMNKDVLVYGDDMKISHIHDIQRCTQCLRPVFTRDSELVELIPHNCLALIDEATRKDPAAFGPRHIGHVYKYSKTKFPKAAPQLLLYLLVFDLFETTQPHDCIYAIRGCVSHFWELPEPDYTLTPEAITSQHTKWFIDQGFGIDMMQLAGLSNAVSDELPSWCPNWTPDQPDRPLSHQLISLLIGDRTGDVPADTPSAGGRMSPRVSFHEDNPSALRAYGSIIDMIKAIAVGVADNFADTFAQYRYVVQEYAAPKPLSDEYLDSVRQFLQQDTYQRPPGVQHIPCSYSRWDYCFDLFHIPSSIIPDDDPFVEQRLQLLFKDVHFPFGSSNIGVTRFGFVGFVPRGSVPSDFVAIFDGGILPLIVREPTEGFLQLVGDAYFPDLAQGEGCGMPTYEPQDLVIV